MSYNNFKPLVWAEEVERELEKVHVFPGDTNRKYEGKVSKMGETVKILGVGKPKVTTQIGGEIILPGAEKVSDTSTSLIIDHVSYFDYLVDDIDKRQSVDGLMDALSKESTLAVADEMDIAIADLAKDKMAVKLENAATKITTDNVLQYIDKGLEKLYDNNVKSNMNITLTVPPWFHTIFRQAYVKLDTNNSEMLKNGIVGKYGNIIVKMSNNVAKDGNGNSLIQLKTNNAIAFANPMTHTEAYRPESRFSDAIKGFVLYGTKIVRPKEMVILNCNA